MITLEQTMWTLAKEYPDCGFTVAVPNGEEFVWSHIIWTDGNSSPCPTEQEAEDLWNNKWKAEWDKDVAEKQTIKENKVSAYRKNGLTDDEILAIDSTLEDNL